MKATITFSIALHWVNKLVAFFIVGSPLFIPLLSTHCKLITIYKVVASVIGRVNVYHLDFAKIVLSQNFEHIKIITLNINILSVPKIHRSLDVGTQSFVSRLVGQTRRSPLVGPSELIAFLALVEHILR